MNSTPSCPASLLALGLLLAAPAAAAQEDDLFARLDRDGNGYIGPQEQRSRAASRNSWVAHDRNRDGRIGRGEFTPMNYAELPRGYSARQLIGSPARDALGRQAGLVRDILVDRRGRVVGLALDRYAAVPAQSASTGATQGESWRVSELLEQEAADVIIGPTGVVRAIVSDRGPPGVPRRHVYPWPRVEFVPGQGIPVLPGGRR